HRAGHRARPAGRWRLHGRSRGGARRARHPSRRAAPWAEPARLPHPHEPRRARSRGAHRRVERSGGSPRRQGGRRRAAASVDSGDRQRDLRRRRHPPRRPPLHPGQGAAGPPREAEADRPGRRAVRDMLPLPLFQHHAPASLDEAIALMAQLGDKARLVAGGTDLVPNMKHGLVEPEHLVSLSRLTELRGIARRGAFLEIGAMTTIQTVADDPLVRREAPALAEAASLVAGPHHRRMGTLGGNVCLDTRCVYYNQTYFWREALGFCLKKDGTQCHVVASGKNCVAAASNDTAPALMALDGTICLAGPEGSREVAANDFYVADGIANTVRK